MRGWKCSFLLPFHNKEMDVAEILFMIKEMLPLKTQNSGEYQEIPKLK